MSDLIDEPVARAPRPDASAPPAPEIDEAMAVLVVEDDPGDMLLVEELLRDALPTAAVSFADTLESALRNLPAPPGCILLDLGLPDAAGFEGVRRLAEAAPDIAIVVLTGAPDGPVGMHAVAAGAQDFLVKGRVDGENLSRAIRYAVERRRADDQAREVLTLAHRRAENARLERGLLPRPALGATKDRVTFRYRPGSEGAQLGGDFYDAIEVDDTTLHVVVGDVAGHGPDEAALGVCLRIAWRATMLAGLSPPAAIAAVDAVLRSEREDDSQFATLCHAHLDVRTGTGTIWSAGHPPPLALDRRCRELDVDTGPLLGIFEGSRWEGQPITLAPGSSLLLFTDGLVEGYARPPAHDRLGPDGACRLAAALPWAADPPRALDELIRLVEDANGGRLVDDLAACLIQTFPTDG